MKLRHFLSISSVRYGILYLQLIFLFQFRLSVANKIVRKPGQYILQGIFPISDAYDPISKQCIHLNPENIQLTQAMIYAISQFINDSPKILPDVTIGWTLIDSCGSSGVTMPSVITELSQSENERYPQFQCYSTNNASLVTNSQSTNTNQQLTVGLIGGKLEKITIPTAAFTSSLAIPQISYFSFDKGLNNRVYYPYFYRTSISFDSHTQYLFDIFNKFNWKWISFVVTDEDSIDLVRSSKSKAYEMYSICYDQIHQLDGNVTQSMLTNAVAKLKFESTAQVIVVLGSEDTIYRFLLEAQSQNLTGKTFVGSYTWLSSQRIYELNYDIIGGAIGIAFDLKSLNGFRKYLNQLDLCNNVDNPWFIEIWNQSLSANNVNLNETQSACKIDKNWPNIALQSLYSPDFKSVFVMDAVLAFGRALHIALGCNSTFCPPLHNNKLDREKFNEILQNVSFAGASSNKFRFGSNGNTESVFDMINLQKNLRYGPGASTVTPVKIGFWNVKNGLNITESKIVWNNNQMLNHASNNSQNNQPPISRCSIDCLPGFYKYQDNNVKSSILVCCWICKECPGSSISNTTNSMHCLQCPYFMQPNANKDRCIDLPEVQERYGRPIIIIYFVLIALYVITLTFIWVIMIIKRKTPIVKGSNFKLTNILLIFNALSVPASFLYLVKPSLKICHLRMFVMTSFVIGTYTTIFCKINQVKIIFDGRAKGNKILSYLSKNRNQFTLITSMIIIVNGILFGLLFVIPITSSKSRTQDNEIEYLCNVPYAYFDIYLLIWIMLLGVLCTYFAFKARTLPDNFNESKYIYLSSIIITITGIFCFPTAFILTGYIADSVTSLAAMLLASSPLLCLFLPKIYIIYFKSELNDRQQILASINNFTFNKANKLQANRSNIESSPTSTTTIPILDRQPYGNKISPESKGITNAFRANKDCKNHQST